MIVWYIGMALMAVGALSPIFCRNNPGFPITLVGLGTVLTLIGWALS